MIRGNKGISLVEILITVALIGIVTPIVSVMFMYGLQDYVTGSRYLEQQTRINTTYLTFRRQYERAREVKLIRDDNTTSPSMSLALELRYWPTDGALDYDQEYRNLFGLNPTTGAIRTNPPYHDDFIDELQAEEAFHTRWEFVEIPSNDWINHPYYGEDHPPSVYGLYVMDVEDITGGSINATLDERGIPERDTSSESEITNHPRPLITGFKSVYEEGVSTDYGKDVDGTRIEPESGIFYWESQKQLWIRIIPIPANRGLFRSRNIIRPLEWHFDYVYKEFKVDDGNS